MKKYIFGFIFITAMSIFVVSCGGSGTSGVSENNDGRENSVVTARTGSDQTVLTDNQVVLVGSASSSDHSILSYAWMQMSGVEVEISNANSEIASFIAPASGDGVLILEFRLTVTNDAGITNSDTCTIMVQAENSEPELETSCDCSPLDAPTGDTVTVSTVDELVNAVNNANSSGGNITVLIKNGTYYLNSSLYITSPDVTFRSVSGNRDDVIISGNGMDGSVPHVFGISASGVTVADLTLGWVYYHGIQVHGENNADDILVHNVRFVNTNEQMLKVSASPSSDVSSDRGTVRCSLFEYTAEIGPQFYIGGIDCHKGIGWNVHDNVFKHIRSPESRLAEHAIHFWSNARDTIVERNTIMNCDRGIGFGLGSSGHIGGIIRNNMVQTTRDVGIGLETASNVKVYNNTVNSTGYSGSIEYRFSGTTGCEIANNLTSGLVQLRNGGSAQLSSNYENAEDSFFIDPDNIHNVNLHLSGEIAQIVDKADLVSGMINDIDCESRESDTGPDIGADEYHSEL